MCEQPKKIKTRILTKPGLYHPALLRFFQGLILVAIGLTLVGLFVNHMGALATASFVYLLAIMLAFLSEPCNQVFDALEEFMQALADVFADAFERLL